MFTRSIYGLAQQATVNASFSCSLIPVPGQWWLLQSLALEVPGYTTGALKATVAIDGAFLCGTNQGQRDHADMRGIRLAPSQVLTVTWNPTAVPGTVQGRATLYVHQFDSQHAMMAGT